MKTQHTPGPWNIDSTEGDIGTPEINVGYAYTWKTPEGQANARLIAAAPELLAALEAIAGKGIMGQRNLLSNYHKNGIDPANNEHEDVCTMPDNCWHCYCVKLARAAIAKATGEG